MSEPCHTSSDRRSPPPRPASVTLSPLKGSVSLTDLHPNQAVNLDEVGESEMVENKLVIPDEMVHYLNQVADTHNGPDFNPSMSWSETVQKSLPSPSQVLPSPGSVNQIPSSNIAQSPSSINQVLPSPQNTNLMSPQVVSQVMLSPGGLSQMIPSPGNTNLNQMLPSPSSNLNNMMNSPNMNQVTHSPSSNMNQMIGSPMSNLNQMASPLSNLNQMVGSPMSNLSQMVASPQNIHPVAASPGYTTVQNPLTSPMSNGSQMVLSRPGMVPSPMRCPAQAIMSPNHQNPMNHINGPHPMMNTSQQIMPQNMQAGDQHQMNMNYCYNQGMSNHNMNHNMCYNMQHRHVNNWNNQSGPSNQNPMCFPNSMSHQNNHHSMCSQFGNQCQTQMHAVNNFNMCNNQNYMQKCQSEAGSNFNCNSSASMYQQPIRGTNFHNCISNMNKPISNPTMTTATPSELSYQTQNFGGRPKCQHSQNCYQQSFYNTCASNSQNMISQTQMCTSCNCQQQQNYQHKCLENVINNSEIQCKDISQSQMSPGLMNQNQPKESQNMNMNSNTNPNNTVQPIGMRQDTYQRTLEYVQNCQSWVGNSDVVTSSTHPLAKIKGEDAACSNMVVNDMTSSLSSLLEENRYLQMIQ